MSGVLIGDKPKHPANKSLSEALREDAEVIKARKGVIDKRATLVKVADGGGEADAGTGATMRPTDEQLQRINGFTRRAVTADEVVAFTTMSCNDLPDRDDDLFTTECVKDFAALEQPFSPVGKSFMLDHAYSTQNAVGRIFGVDTTKAEGATFLTNEVYMPNTAQFQPLIEKIDFGINWAVSVGVMLGKDECSLSFCKAPFSSWGYWCQNGHDKGMYYTEDAEEDSWGYPLPCDSRTSGAEKCLRAFSNPRDMYELSQVFLGAQYFAQLDKDPSFKSLVKAATAGVPIIGASAEEAKKLPLPHEPEKLSAARKAGIVKEADDGSLVWTDSEGLRWTFDPENPDDGVLSLGKATNDESEEDEDGEHEVPGGANGDDLGEVDGDSAPQPDAGAGVGGSGSSSDPADPAGVKSSGESDSGEPGSAVDDDETDDDSEDSDEDDSEDSDDDDGEEKSAVSKSLTEAVAKAVAKAQLPEAVAAAAANGLPALLLAASSEISSLAEQVSELTPKAALGDQFIKELRADAIHAYVMNHATKDQPKVATATFEKILDRCGDDVELLKALHEEQMEEARKKFPKPVARSSFPSDPNEVKPLGNADIGEVKEGGDDNDLRVKRIHG